MSQYSEMMGSFIRTGNYPMEANYIFPTKAALEEFYTDPINAATLHKGLLRVVETDTDDKQALYWVVKDTDDSLKFVRLIKDVDIDTINEELSKLSDKLDKEIKTREDNEEAIWGTKNPSEIPGDLDSILDLSKAITQLKKEFQDTTNLLKSQIKATVGTEEDDIIKYLQKLPYKSLTEVSTALNKFLNTVDSDSEEINTLPELKSFLEGYKDTDKLKSILDKLYNDILGDPLPTAQFRTLRGIEDFIRVLKSESEAGDHNLQTELDTTQIGVGLSGDGSYNADKETHYLQDATSVMNALKILDGYIFTALKGITITANNSDVVDLAVRKENSEYVIGAKLNLSNVIGNDLIKKEDGLYFNVKSTYNNGTLSLYVNDKLISQHILGFSSIVESAVYDSSNEAIVIVFKLLNGEKQTISIPVGALIRELEVDNSQPDKVVELSRTTVIDGADKLSADVRINTDKHNILKKVGNTLSVDGTSNSITHNDKTLSSVLEEIKKTEADSSSSLNTKIDSEIDRAKAEEASLKTKDTELTAAIQAETTRATGVEDTLKVSIQDLKDTDSAINKSIESIKETVLSNSKEITAAKDSINSEITRATEQEKLLANTINTKVGKVSIKKNEANDLQYILYVDDKVSGEINIPSDQFLQDVKYDSVSKSLVFTFITKEGSKTTSVSLIDLVDTYTSGDGLQLENNKFSVRKCLGSQKYLEISSDGLSIVGIDEALSLKANVGDSYTKEESDKKYLTTHQDISSLATKAEVKIVSDELTKTNANLQKEVERATTAETTLTQKINSKVDSVVLNKVSDLKYDFTVNGISIGQIDIPKDQFLKSVTLENDSILRFVFETTTGTVTTDINIKDVSSAALSDLQKEINKKANIESPTFTGIPQVATSPDLEDSSQRIPSTVWVNTKIKEAVSKVDTTTYITREQVEELLATKADLVDGLVPISQLPATGWIDVE